MVPSNAATDWLVPFVTTQVAFVSTFRMVTFALGTTACELSVTVPRMVPNSDWAESGITRKKRVAMAMRAGVMTSFTSRISACTAWRR